jgi:hypothetical protein
MLGCWAHAVHLKLRGDIHTVRCNMLTAFRYLWAVHESMPSASLCSGCLYVGSLRSGCLYVGSLRRSLATAEALLCCAGNEAGGMPVHDT